jgi:hypothetical protein
MNPFFITRIILHAWVLAWWGGPILASWWYFFAVGVIASVIYYYICWVWLVGTHFQIIDFNIYMVQFFLMQKT